MTLLSLLLIIANQPAAAASVAVVRRYVFDVVSDHAPLRGTLPPATAVHRDWPPAHLRADLPDYLRIASIRRSDNGNVTDGAILSGPPVHVARGEMLSVSLRNSLQASGLSIHWHGFEMEGSPQYDGVSGVTQCPLSPGLEFDYRFAVDEEAGTYWYHTHAGTLGLDARDTVKGPLIVHPAGSEDLVDVLNGEGTNERYRLAYGDERILFFSDGHAVSDAVHNAEKLGGLVAPVSRNDDGFVVASQEWKFGTCNGRLREVVPVAAGQRYKLRLINGGQHFGYRISIGGLPLTVVAADSEPVQPFAVDEVILHAAERLDVEINIPPDATAGEDSWWIKADTLESTWQGYRNGIRAVLHVVDPASLPTAMVGAGTGWESLWDVPDPTSPIGRDDNLGRTTLNCYSTKEVEAAEESGHGGCLPITSLRPNLAAKVKDQSLPSDERPPEVHVVDFEFTLPPQFGHFVRLDGGAFAQHVTPLKSMMDPSFNAAEDMHPHTQVLHVGALSTVIIVWRTTSSFDHPIHLHGYKMEVLEVVRPRQRRESCSVLRCELPDDFENEDRLRRLLEERPPGSAVVKDTFILPAGGAVVTRVFTQQPALWFAHCHIENHREDGMAFILNVGNYTAPANGSWLPQDYPPCDTPFLLSRIPHPACDCYEWETAVLNTGLTDQHQCSREHLCHHKHSQVANLDNYVYKGGFAIASDQSTPQWAISLIIIICVFVATFIINKISCTRCLAKWQDGIKNSDRPERRESELSLQLARLTVGSHATGSEVPIHSVLAIPAPVLAESEGDIHSAASLDANEEFDEHSTGNVCLKPTEAKNGDSIWRQLVDGFVLEWQNYSPIAINALRVVEVTGLAALTGILFYSTGKDTSVVGLSQKTSLLFFGATLWTFERMYPSLVSYSGWIVDASKEMVEGQKKAVPLWLGRLFAVNLAEFFWPFIYVSVCHTMSGVAGDASRLMKNGILLALNNICYVSFGSMLGSVAPSVPYALICSTIVGQTSLVAAGFYTNLPPVVEYLRYASPVFWCYKGILKASYSWSDSYDCLHGSSDIGANQCFIEYDLGIDQTKKRGIEVATFNDPKSEEVFIECIALVAIFWFLQLIILLRLKSVKSCCFKRASVQ